VVLRPLKERKAIQELWTTGLRVVHPMLLLVVQVADAGAPPGSVGYVVSVPRRRVKKAVVRSRIRRLLREALRQLLPRFALKLPLQAVALVWRGNAPEHPARIRLHDVLPVVQEVLQQAVSGSCVRSSSE
jgi:ribonuclease P protein component